MPTVDLRGAELAILAPLGQPVEVLFDFGAVDVSGWGWIGQVRSDPTSVVALAAFTFSNPIPTQLLATLSALAVGMLGVGGWGYEIEQVAPTARQMFYGKLTIVQDVAR